MLKEGGREDRTSLTLNYFDVSCVSCFDVQRGRKGGQNIMDFVNYLDVSRMNYFDTTSRILNYFDVSCINFFDVQRGRKGGRNIMDFALL